MEAEGEFTPEGATEREKGGTLVILTDMWTSKDMPAFAAMNAFRDASSREYAHASAALMEGIAAAFAEDPRLKVGFEQSVQEMQKMDGMPMKTTISFVAVAPEQKFDRQLALQARIVPEERLVTVYNGVPDVAPDLRSRPGRTPVRLIMVARFAPQKDHITLLRALAGLPRPSSVPAPIQRLKVPSITVVYRDTQALGGVVDAVHHPALLRARQRCARHQ
jgi:hypothetical protein